MHTPMLETMPDPPVAAAAPQRVAVLGLGYVGLPTALGLTSAGYEVVGVDVSPERLATIRGHRADLLPRDRGRLAAALDGETLALHADPAAIAAADAVVVCVPTPVDEDRRPDLGPLRAACAAVVEHARPGQLLVLTSTTYVGTTRELLCTPLAERGLVPGEDVCVAFSPERIDPGNASHDPERIPRVVAGATEACGRAAADLLAPIAPALHRVTSLEAAELTKLYENTFRAVNIALANELAGIGRSLGLDPVEVTEAAATKPYGFMPFYPSAGVGGHCIPCDPHYLLASVDGGAEAPLVAQAMGAIAQRPARVAERAVELLGADGIGVEEARVLVVGATYKPGVRDVRESPGVEILRELHARGADVDVHDPLVDVVAVNGPGSERPTVEHPDPAAYDLVVLATVQPGAGLEWLARAERVLDATYRVRDGRRRFLV